MFDDIVYHKLNKSVRNQVDLPRNPNEELFTLPLRSGEKITFDVTAMNDHWNSIAVDYNASTPLEIDIVRGWLQEGSISKKRVNRFIDFTMREQAKGNVTRFRPLLGVQIANEIHIIDGRHRYASMLASCFDLVQAGNALDVPTFVFLEDEWPSFVVRDGRTTCPVTNPEHLN